jgi:hypothetical protein
MNLDVSLPAILNSAEPGVIPSRRASPISVGGIFAPSTASATISPITGPCLKPWPEATDGDVEWIACP